MMTHRTPPASRLALWLLLLCIVRAHAADPLPSWQEGAAKHSIIQFVNTVITPGTPGFVPTAARIAVFDNDGTLWSEQPAYFQVLFAFDEIHRLAPQHPDWKTTQPFKAVLDNDHAALAASGMDGLMKIVAASHTGLTTEAFSANVQAWLGRARHPRSGQPYTAMVYQPMLELLAYLRHQGFTTWIVSGGDTAFMRTFAEQVYGVPPQQVIGSQFTTAFQPGSPPTLLRTATLAHNDDGPGKPESIDAIIGQRPILAFGNSDGDLAMLQWTAAGPGPRWLGLVHHTDGQREWAYDRQSSVGRLDKALDEAALRHWTVVDMAADWRQVYPFERPAVTEQHQQ